MGGDKPKKLAEWGAPGLGERVDKENERLGIRETTSSKKAKESNKLAGEQAEAAKQARILEEEDTLRKKRNSIFQTEGGTSGATTMSVGARDTFFGN